MLNIKVDNEIELQLFQPYHAVEYFRLVERNRYHLREWLPWVDEVRSPTDASILIQMGLNRFFENNEPNFGIRFRGVLVGNIDFHDINWYNRQTQLGYFLSQSAQGYGIMTRSVQSIIHYAFRNLELHRIEIRCGEKNQKSRAIPERLGFTYEGCLRDGEYLHGRFHHIFVYSMLSHEWNRK
ncbi:GNAT family N-acetyltransferase [Robertmurraya sp. Marseille-Q9965]